MSFPSAVYVTGDWSRCPSRLRTKATPTAPSAADDTCIPMCARWVGRDRVGLKHFQKVAFPGRDLGGYVFTRGPSDKRRGCSRIKSAGRRPTGKVRPRRRTSCRLSAGDLDPGRHDGAVDVLLAQLTAG